MSLSLYIVLVICLNRRTVLSNMELQYFLYARLD